MVAPPTKIDLRPNPDLVGVIEVPWKAIHSKVKHICPEKMLLERKHVSDFEQVLKEIDFRILCRYMKLKVTAKIGVELYFTQIVSFYFPI